MRMLHMTGPCPGGVNWTSRLDSTVLIPASCLELGDGSGLTLATACTGTDSGGSGSSPDDVVARTMTGVYLYRGAAVAAKDVRAGSGEASEASVGEWGF